MTPLRYFLPLLLCTAPALRAQPVDTTMIARVAEQRRLDSIAEHFPPHSSYREYDPEALSRMQIFGRIPAAVKRRYAADLTQYLIVMDTAGYGINLNTMDSDQARTAIQSIEMVLYRDRLIKASVFFDESHGDLWERWYFDGRMCFLGTASPFDMLIQTNLDYTEFFPFADRLERDSRMENAIVTHDSMK